MNDSKPSKVETATGFFSALLTGETLKPTDEFRGVKLQNRSPEEMICDCCGDGGDCCGFN